MASLRAQLTFPEEMIERPVIWELGSKFDIVTNIRRASVDQKAGWVVLEMTGTEKELERGTEYLKSLGVSVNPVEKDVVES